MSDDSLFNDLRLLYSLVYLKKAQSMPIGLDMRPRPISNENNKFTHVKKYCYVLHKIAKS